MAETIGGVDGWRGLTKSQLDASYNNMVAVTDSDAYLVKWSERSALLRARQARELEIDYGPGARNRFDVFRCGAPSAPMLVFIHGGWWQRNSKEVFSCIAAGPMAHGFDVALVGYTLAPEARLTQIAKELRIGLDTIATYQAARGVTDRMLLSGWSAGGHLTALLLDHPAVTAGLAISGVFDLEPIRHSYINDKLQLSPLEVANLSPVHRPATTKPLTLAYGLSELSEMQRQSRDYCTHSIQRGMPVSSLPLTGHDHFSIVEELIDSGGSLTAAVCDLASVQD